MKADKVLQYVPLLLTVVALLALPFLFLAPPVQGAPPAHQPFASGRILVKFQPWASPADKAALHRAQGAHMIQMIPGIEVEVVSVPAGVEEGKVMAYARHPHVAYAEPDYIAYALEGPSDPKFVHQWGLNNIGQVYKAGQPAGTVDADIDAPEAWQVPQGNPAVLIAILDTGIDQDHEDLAAGKIAGNVNFSSSTTPDDLYGHGTHVAGIAAAVTDNDTGVAGVGYNSSLLNVKVLNDQASGYYSWIVNGIIWAANNGAKVINMSLGGNSPSRTLENAVNYAWSKGVLLACAGGNDGSSRPTYPAKYDKCIAVAATDASDRKASWSSYSNKWMDVAAPGVEILSTFPNHPYAIDKSLNYDYGSGTSMATPHVAGLAALVWSTSYGASNQAVRSRIESTADRIAGTGTYWIYGRINACKAVEGSCN